MGIEDDLHDRQNTAGLKGAEQFRKGAGAGGNLAKNGDQDRAIKVIDGERPIAESRRQEVHMGESGRRQPGLCAGQHSLLDVQRDHTTARSNAAGQRNGQAPRAAPGIQDRHSGGKPQRFDYKRSPVCLGQRVVQLYEPTQPNGTGKTPAAGGLSPDDGHKNYRGEYKYYGGGWGHNCR